MKESGFSSPIYKGKRDKGKFKNYKGISMLCVVDKVYGKIPIDGVRKISDNLISNE